MKFLTTLFYISLALNASYGLEITSFSKSGAMEWHSEDATGTVVIERICNLKDTSGWIEIERLAVTGETCRVNIDLCNEETAYYRLKHYTPVQTTDDRKGSSEFSEVESGTLFVQKDTSTPDRALETDNSDQNDLNDAAPSECVVAIKNLSADEFILLEEARLKIKQHWSMIYPDPLVFKNEPGSPADLQDMADALNDLSQYFYHN